MSHAWHASTYTIKTDECHSCFAPSLHLTVTRSRTNENMQVTDHQSVMLCRRMLTTSYGSGLTKLMMCMRGCSRLNSQRARCHIDTSRSSHACQADSLVAVIVHSIGQHPCCLMGPVAFQYLAKSPCVSSFSLQRPNGTA